MSLKKETNSKLVHYNVTAGLIRYKGKILITQRPLNKQFGGLWEFPGGKQMVGETLKQCLAREITEELNIEIQIGDKLMSVHYSDDSLLITLYVFLCDHPGGELECREVHDFRWIEFSDLDHYELTKPDQMVIDKLKAFKQISLWNESL
jgi:mutator protein MutT